MHISAKTCWTEKCKLLNEVSGAIQCFWHLFCGFFVNLMKKSLTICLWGGAELSFLNSDEKLSTEDAWENRCHADSKDDLK